MGIVCCRCPIDSGPDFLFRLIWYSLPTAPNLYILQYEPATLNFIRLIFRTT